MQITGIEVIRGNHGNPGVIGVPAGEKLPVEVGDTVRVHMTVEHRGPRIENAEVYTAIGWQTGIIIPEFIEAYVGRTPGLTFDESLDFVTHEIVCDVPIEPITMPVEFALYGSALDIYAKIINVPGPDIFTDPFYYKVIEISAPPVEYEPVYHHEYPRGKTYVGKAEACTTTFTVPLPEQLFPDNWVIEKIADTFADEVTKEGGEMLDIKIYQDATPTWHTNYRIVATAIASPLPWTPIILLILAIILVVAFTNLVVQFKEIDWGEIPAAIPWAILAAVGGLGVLGVGAAIALAGKRD